MMTSEDTFYYAKLSQLGVEEWLPIPGYEGYYEVSNLGRVKSVERVVARSNKTQCSVRELILKPIKSGCGRHYVGLCRTSERKTCSIHTLMALAFIGPRPVNKDVAHNDGDCLNNSLYNLRYATRKENEADKRKHGTQPRGDKVASSKLNELDVRAIRRLLDEGNIPQTEIAKQYGINRRSIYEIASGKSWGWLE